MLGNKCTALGCPIYALSFSKESLDALCICNVIRIGQQEADAIAGLAPMAEMPLSKESALLDNRANLFWVLSNPRPHLDKVDPLLPWKEGGLIHQRSAGEQREVNWVVRRTGKLAVTVKLDEGNADSRSLMRTHPQR